MQKYLLIIPRHAERHSKIVKFFRISKFSRCQKLRGIDESGVDVCLVDTTGEFQMLTQMADLAFIGKNLSPKKVGSLHLMPFVVVFRLLMVAI
jgi:3-deoxy-D-manno-octulosonic-acid transferase